MIKKISVLIGLLSFALVVAVSAVSPARVAAEMLDCKVAHYRTLGHRLWFHHQAMVDRFDCDCDWNWED